MHISGGSVPLSLSLCVGRCPLIYILICIDVELDGIISQNQLAFMSLTLHNSIRSVTMMMRQNAKSVIMGYDDVGKY